MNIFEYPINVALTLFSNPALYLVVVMLIAIRFTSVGDKEKKITKRILWVALAVIFFIALTSPSHTYKHEPHDKEAGQRAIEHFERQDREQARDTKIEDRSRPITPMAQDEFDDKVDWRNRPSRGE